MLLYIFDGKSVIFLENHDRIKQINVKIHFI